MTTAVPPIEGISPDASLMQDEGVVATSFRGLTYPLGARTPGLGESIALRGGVHWVRVPMGGALDHINCWLVEDGARTTLVDTGLNIPDAREAWERLVAAPLLARYPIGRVICTHFHPDHIGLAGWFAAKPDTDIWMTRGEWLTARLVTVDLRDEVPADQVAFWRAAGWDEGQIDAMRARGFRRMADLVAPLPQGYRRIVDGETIAIGDGAWRVVTGSGHCPEHACLWYEAEGLLISGDQILPRISSNVSLVVSEPEADPLGEWLASIDKLLMLPDDLLVLPAHGDPFTGLHVRLAGLRDEHLKRLDILHAHLSEPRRAVDCFGRMFRRVIEHESLWLATGETLAHLRRLEVEGRAVRDVRDGVWWYRAA